MDEHTSIGASLGWWREAVKRGFVRRPPADIPTRQAPKMGTAYIRHAQLKRIGVAIVITALVMVLMLARFAYAPPNAPLIAQNGIPVVSAEGPETARLMEKIDPLPADRSVPLTPVQVQRLMVQAGFPNEEIGTGIKVAQAESSLIPNNTNVAGNTHGTDRGLFQINDYYWRDDLVKIDWTDPQANVNLAFKVWQIRGGWSAWSTYRKDPAGFEAAKAPAPLELPSAPRLILCRTDMFPGTKPNVAQVAHNVAGATAFTGTIGGYANRQKKVGGISDHALGLALDFMVYEDERKGNAIADYIVQNAGPLHVSYVMWAGRINNLDGKGWIPFPDRGNPTDNHFDHPHVSFKDAPADVTCLPEWRASPPVWR